MTIDHKYVFGLMKRQKFFQLKFKDSVEEAIMYYTDQRRRWTSHCIHIQKLEIKHLNTVSASGNSVLTSNQQHSQQEVREQSSEVDHFPGPADPLPDTEVTEDPHQQQSTSQLPADVTNVFNSARDLKHSASKENTFHLRWSDDLQSYCLSIIVIDICYTVKLYLHWR